MKKILLLPFLLCGFAAHDGDTITKISYRLAYIDAPELNQTCHARGVEIPIGRQAQVFLNHIADASKVMACKVMETDRYGRMVADCDFNLLMVRRGYALCYDKYITDKNILRQCHNAQTLAKVARYGLWQCDDFVSPAEWRRK